MNFSKIFFKWGLFNEEIEFISILILLLFFPDKSSFFYFLIFAVLMILFLIRKIIISKNIGISVFSKFLLFSNIIFLFSVIFSVYILRSLLFFFDIFLITSYFIIHFHEERFEGKYFNFISIMISIFSLLNLLYFFFNGEKNLFFQNPIFMGIISGIAALIFLFKILGKFSFIEFFLMLINISSLFVSESKAAFLGVVIFSALLVLLKKKVLIPVIAVLLLITFIIPNPVKKTFHYSIYKDPYSKNRIDIWKMSIRIFKDNPITGVGLNNFGEISKKYNFKQQNGPANYFKVPMTPHNDYFKVISETGIPGLLLIFFSLFFIFKKIFSGSLFDIKKILILYLLFQALFFNIIFKTFFFFLFIFLLKSLFKENIVYENNSTFFRFSSIFILLITITAGYVFPYYSEILLEKAKGEKDIIKVFKTLKKSQFFNPINIKPHFYEALIHYNFFRRNSNMESFSAVLSSIKKVQRLNCSFTESYLLESDLFLEVFKKGLSYPSLEQEIISPLETFEYHNPYDPFVKLGKADIHLKFGNKMQAVLEAKKSLEIEPDFISALYFLHRNFDHFKGEENFRKIISVILQKRKKINTEAGSYLDSVFKIPADLDGKAITMNRLK
ncbi:MAG: O-antigen ligase family protein [Acidobacteriota bacterium]